MSLLRRHPGGRQLPTNAELRILRALWKIGQGTVEDVIQHLPSAASANYKTVQTFLRIMEQKGFVRHVARGRAFVFEPCISREEVGQLTVRNVLEQHFNGSRAQLLINLLGDGRIEESELDELEELIRRYRAQRTVDSSKME